MKKIYGLLCVIGFALPYYFFLPFLRSYGFNVPLLLHQMFSNPVAAFFAADVIVSSLVLWVFIYQETRKHKIQRWWLCIIANLTVGVSLALPLFLLFREIEKNDEFKATPLI